MGKQFLHYDLGFIGSDDVIEVNLDHAANVQLLDPDQYENYRNGRAFRYYGGHVKQHPFRIAPPHQAHWHLVIDLGGRAGAVRASVSVKGQEVGV